VSSYDEVPYTSYPYLRTHPDRLCTVARLFGMRPASVQRCRVLEIGCGSGGNLVPMAELLPQAEFVGLDASARQVAMAQELIADAGLDNVRIEHASILDVDASWGSFDYIICHGVYSWVDAEVQAKILAIMGDLLEPHGVGYLSYNVYPGWHMRESIRHMMRYHVRSLESHAERTSQARALVDFLATHVPDDDGPYARLLRKELQVLEGTTGDYIFHEHLEDVNEPLYFHQLAERLGHHGLAYLGEADVQTMVLEQYAPAAAKALARIAPDIVSMEQYMDFVRNRQFRTTLVCRGEVALQRSVSPDVVESLHVSFAPGPDARPIDLSPDLVQEFVSADEVKLSSSRPLTKAALVLLRARWPRPLSFEQLVNDADALLAEAGIEVESSARSDLAADLLECHFGGAGVSLRSWAPPLAERPGDRPCTTRVARAQAARGGHVATVLHETAHLDRAPANILRLLDGERTEREIIEALSDLVVAGKLDLSREGEPIRERDQMREPLAAILRNTLPSFAKRGLLLDSPFSS
jgi:methyltransferase-like protein/SAM-dependent methyltransferase